MGELSTDICSLILSNSISMTWVRRDQEVSALIGCTFAPKIPDQPATNHGKRHDTNFFSVPVLERVKNLASKKRHLFTSV